MRRISNDYAELLATADKVASNYHSLADKSNRQAEVLSDLTTKYNALVTRFNDLNTKYSKLAVLGTTTFNANTLDDRQAAYCHIERMSEVIRDPNPQQPPLSSSNAVLARVNNLCQNEIETEQLTSKSGVDKIFNNGRGAEKFIGANEACVKRQISFSPAAETGELKVDNPDTYEAPPKF